LTFLDSKHVVLPQVLEPIIGLSCSPAATAPPSRLLASSLLPAQQQTPPACCRGLGSTKSLGARPVLHLLWLGAWSQFLSSKRPHPGQVGDGHQQQGRSRTWLQLQEGRSESVTLAEPSADSLTMLRIPLPALPPPPACCRCVPGARLPRPQQQQRTRLHHRRPASLHQQQPTSRCSSAGPRRIPACRAPQEPCIQPCWQADGRGSRGRGCCRAWPWCIRGCCWWLWCSCMDDWLQGFWGTDSRCVCSLTTCSQSSWLCCKGCTIAGACVYIHASQHSACRDSAREYQVVAAPICQSDVLPGC
jgi:hypothetical protein